MARWERVSIDEAIYAGIDALSDAYRTGEPQAAIGAFLKRKITAATPDPLVGKDTIKGYGPIL